MLRVTGGSVRAPAAKELDTRLAPTPRLFRVAALRVGASAATVGVFCAKAAAAEGAVSSACAAVAVGLAAGFTGLAAAADAPVTARR